MKKYMRFVAIAIAVVLGSLAVLNLTLAEAGKDDRGNPNDPRVNERANACYEGAAMEFKCGDDPVLWEAGWYLIRFQYGLIGADQVPDELKWVIPSSTEEAPGAVSTEPTKPVETPAATPPL